jgi:hypothetical protein
MSVDVLHPDRYGPVMRDIVTDGPVHLADDH